jgi:hypothetical protein
MKKLMIGVMVAATLSACEKEETFVRNYTYPINLSDPTGTQGSGNIQIYENESDKTIMNRVKKLNYLDGKNIIYLSPEIYSLTGDDSYTVKNPNPDYMLFPHSINSTSDEWGWDYYYEYVNLGEQVFCNKYLNGKLTLGMKLK